MRIKARTLTLIAMAAACSMAVTASGATPKLPSLGDGTFATDMSLSKPKALKPNGSASLVYPNDSLKLSWGAVPGATTYDVQVSRQPSANVNCRSTTAWQAENILFTHETSELGWVPEQVDEESGKGMWTGTYCWRVRAAGKKPGQWSVSHKFDISWPATATNLRFFADENGPIPRTGAGDVQGFDTGYLEWSEVAGASRYEVQISEAPTFGSDSLFASKVYSGTRMLLPQMPDNQYTWRVRPIAGNGVTGNWSRTATFTIQRDTRYWTSDGSSLYPTNGAVTSDVRMGWEPVPGASYYRYMGSTSVSGFTELDSQGPYGTPGENCEFFNTRLSSADESASSTINNWVTFGGFMDPAVVANLYTWCDESVRPDLPSTIHWRVYPVWQLSPETETGWDVKPAKIVGSAVQRHFTLQPHDDNDVDPVAGGQCNVNNGGTNYDCNRLANGGMSPKNPSPHSTTMQVPYFQWSPYPAHAAAWPENGDGPGSFRVQIARDSEFNNQVIPPGASNLIRGWIATLGPLRFTERASSSEGMTRFGQVSQSFALTTGLPDEGQDNNGYFWRSLPCTSVDSKQNQHTLCHDHYVDETESIHSPGMSYGVPASGALEFRKRVEVRTEVTPNFSAGMPLLKVGPTDAGTDFAKWQRGIQGADHYEFELARSQTFEGARLYKTTVPRIVPWGKTPADLLEPGTWFWRVRAVDRDGLKGSWSDRSSFAIKSNAPIILATSETSGRGVTVEWTTVPGASGYEIQWSSDPTFATGVTVRSTAQSAYFVPGSSTGTKYWRVRAQIGGGEDATFSEWSLASTAQILAQNRVRFSVNRATVTAGATAIVDAQLLVAGTPTNGKKVMLQRKTTSCASAKGAYRTIKTGVSGRRTTDGHVRYRFKASVSACYRLRAASGSGIVFSAPFKIGAKPTVRFNVLNRTVRRGNAICTRTTSRQRLTGRLRIQYRVGKTWRTARTVNVRNMKSRRQCATISRAGYFPIRVQLDRLNHSKGGYRIYETTTVSSGRVRVNDTYVVRPVR